MTDAYLDEVEARCARATAGPWLADLDVYDPDTHEIVAGVSNKTISLLALLDTGFALNNMLTEEECAEKWRMARESQELKDATFIAAARTDLPAVVAELRRVRALEAK